MVIGEIKKTSMVFLDYHTVRNLISEINILWFGVRNRRWLHSCKDGIFFM